MRAYELMVIIDRDADDAGIRAVIDMVSNLVKAEDGEVRKTDMAPPWGRRPFAYVIKRNGKAMTEGFYVVFEIATNANNLDDLERNLRIADDVVRHKVIRLPDKEAARRGLTEAAPA